MPGFEINAFQMLSHLYFTTEPHQEPLTWYNTARGSPGSHTKSSFWMRGKSHLLRKMWATSCKLCNQEVKEGKN
jgi:hypothetical protein